MAAWQILYHSIVAALAVVTGVMAYRREFNQLRGCIVLMAGPICFATIAEIVLNVIVFPNMLASDAQAGIGMVIAWGLNIIISFVGIIAGFVGAAWHKHWFSL